MTLVEFVGGRWDGEVIEMDPVPMDKAFVAKGTRVFLFRKRGEQRPVLIDAGIDPELAEVCDFVLED